MSFVDISLIVVLPMSHSLFLRVVECLSCGIQRQFSSEPIGTVHKLNQIQINQAKRKGIRMGGHAKIQ